MERITFETLLPRLQDYISKYAKECPDKVAMIDADDGSEVSYKKFESLSDFFALRLKSMGIGKGDIIATSLPLLKEFVLLVYGAFKIGAIVAPLDLRLKAHEIVRSIQLINPKIYFFLGKTPIMDFRPMIEKVKEECPQINYWVQFTVDPSELIKGAMTITQMMDKKKLILLKLKDIITGSLKRVKSDVGKKDPVLIIFTTGSTGKPKPALLSHENIIVQNLGLYTAFEMKETDRMVVNLPNSHVGCMTEQLMTTFFGGGTNILIRVFDPLKTLQAIEKYKATIFGQIPTQFNLEWALPDFKKYDYSTLRFAIYGGSMVTTKFLEQLRKMAPRMGTGLGLTESAGFVTYTDPDVGLEEIARSVGKALPFSPVTIREPMLGNGLAGKALPPDQVGEICIEGPQVFLGYYKMPEETAKAISKDGVCYTGDIGSLDSKGYLQMKGRSKFMIKQKGYNVYPADVEEFISKMDRVAEAAVVGLGHEIFSEGILAFVKPKPGAKITAEEVMEHCKGMASYARPLHVEIFTDPFPMTRVNKVDYLALKETGVKIVEKLRSQGGWDKKKD